MPISLVLADDHQIVLKGLEQLFSSEPDLKVLASCTDGEQALAALHRHQPDMLVLDLRMPRMDGLTLLRRMQAEQLPTRVVLLTAELDDDEVVEAIRLGVRGLVLKEMAPQLLLQCVRAVHAGSEWLEKHTVSRTLETLVQRESELKQLSRLLTSRELELLRLAAGGLANQEIADRLFISEGTVKVHLHRIYVKLQLKNRVALTLFAREKGLV